MSYTGLSLYDQFLKLFYNFGQLLYTILKFMRLCLGETVLHTSK